ALSLDTHVGTHLILLRKIRIVRNTTLFPYTTLFRSLGPQQVADADLEELVEVGAADAQEAQPLQQGDLGVQCLGQHAGVEVELGQLAAGVQRRVVQDRKSTRLNSSHVKISYAVFCLQK